MRGCTDAGRLTDAPVMWVTPRAALCTFRAVIAAYVPALDLSGALLMRSSAPSSARRAARLALPVAALVGLTGLVAPTTAAAAPLPDRRQ